MKTMREAREDAGRNLCSLAQMSELALRTLWQIESGSQPRPQLSTILKIAGPSVSRRARARSSGPSW